MWTVEKNFRIKLGGITFVNVPDLVVYKGQTLFTLKRNDQSGDLGIFFEIFDAGGRHIASVKRNRIYQRKSGADLYEMKDLGEECLLREISTGEVVCSIRRTSDAPVELDVSVRLYTPDGFPFHATPTETVLPQDNTWRDCHVQGFPVGIEILGPGKICVG